MLPDSQSLDHALYLARQKLLDQRTPAGHWVGELSTSALSTATAVFALHLYARAREREASHYSALVSRGLNWLGDHQNPDGGWGDTSKSFSNISTTTLCWAAFASHASEYADTIRRCESWLTSAAGSLEPAQLAKSITARYGKDKTFSVPILTMAALAGRLGPPDHAWRLVPQLPFELAAAPHQLYAALRLPVVSYALPALIAIGQVRHALHPTRNPITRPLRNALKERTLNILRSIQPQGGGFLEAAPLTSFVSMSLIAAGLHDHPVVREGIDFLVRSVRPDGSWPIDTNLSTWVTTLSVNALHADADFTFPQDERARLVNWLLDQQYKTEHPYTHAPPGGWAWTDLPGGVPDADDTPGALIALHNLAPTDPRVIEAARHGVSWLLGLQNRDGGIPTFCRGWTGLPFDRSGADLTAHALLAWGEWHSAMPRPLADRISRARGSAIQYLMSTQRNDGSWLPLWFGNQSGHDDENPVYGTARVLPAMIWEEANHAPEFSFIAPAIGYLISAQNNDGGWGGAKGIASTIEETALALHALCTRRIAGPSAQLDGVIASATHYLVERVQTDSLEPSAIGFYFARLWYYERLYPLIFTVQALSSASHALRPGSGRL